MSASKRYREMILSAMQWALNEQCPAWKRTIDYVTRHQDLFDISGVNQALFELKGEATEHVESWFIERFADEGGEDFTKIEFMSPEDLWIEIVLNNNKPFGGLKDPLEAFLIAVPAKIRHTAPLWLKPNFDGWGIGGAEQTRASD